MSMQQMFVDMMCIVPLVVGEETFSQNGLHCGQRQTCQSQVISRGMKETLFL